MGHVIAKGAAMDRSGIG